MLGIGVPEVFLVVVTLASVVLGQSCIRNEVLAVLEEVQTNSPSVASSENQGACNNLVAAQIEELNSTLQGFQDNKAKFKEVRRDIKEELQEVKTSLQR